MSFMSMVQYVDWHWNSSFFFFKILWYATQSHVLSFNMALVLHLLLAIISCDAIWNSLLSKYISWSLNYDSQMVTYELDFNSFIMLQPFVCLSSQLLNCRWLQLHYMIGVNFLQFALFLAVVIMKAIYIFSYFHDCT